MPQVDYKLSDHWYTPIGMDKWYVEKLVRLPGGYGCFSRPHNTGPVTPPPALRNGYITFGSFNFHLKMNSFVVSLWSQVLQACPDARLLLKFSAGSDEEMRRRYYAEFARHGVAAERIRMFGRIAPEAHWKLFQQMDIALDTYPFSGCITTLDALWMGVPVVSLAGPAFASRQSFTILARIGFEKFVASSGEQYVAKAAALAANTEALHTLRMTMRQRLQNSSVFDVKQFGREIAQAFRGMWRDYCREQGHGETASELVSSQPGAGRMT
jgi:predicted O-linked N-acetylglucosamine transferase (SPINDLY family)